MKPKDKRVQFMNLKKFETVYDIPNLPIVDKQEWECFYVPKLIEAGAIPKKDLQHNKYYTGKCRNTQLAIWDKVNQKFHYERNKYNTMVKETINHFEDDDGYDLFIPIKKVK